MCSILDITEIDWVLFTPQTKICTCLQCNCSHPSNSWRQRQKPDSQNEQNKQNEGVEHMFHIYTHAIQPNLTILICDTDLNPRTYSMTLSQHRYDNISTRYLYTVPHIGANLPLPVRSIQSAYMPHDLKIFSIQFSWGIFMNFYYENLLFACTIFSPNVLSVAFHHYVCWWISKLFNFLSNIKPVF